MRPLLLVLVGALAVLAGIIWTAQGLGYISGSFMTGQKLWVVIGPLVALAGLALIIAGLRGRHRAR